MLGSLSHADINSAFALFSYYILLTHRQHQTLQ